MDTVTVIPLEDVPEDLLAERKRRGLDRYDEVWNGVLHMNPSPIPRHAHVAVVLFRALDALAADAGFSVLWEQNLIPPHEPGWNDYRIPDLIVFGPDVEADRGIQGAPELVVEIGSPGDESFQKLPFYEEIGAREVLIIERDTAAIRRWVNGADGLVEQVPADGVHHLACLPVVLRTVDGELHAVAGPH
ncbi:MAG: Uma2 family endonuclease [Aquihabitans sp.]